MDGWLVEGGRLAPSFMSMCLPLYVFVGYMSRHLGYDWSERPPMTIKVTTATTNLMFARVFRRPAQTQIVSKPMDDSTPIYLCRFARVFAVALSQ